MEDQDAFHGQVVRFAPIMKQTRSTLLVHLAGRRASTAKRTLRFEAFHGIIPCRV